MKLQQVPVVKTEMLIRKSVSEVFDAFVDPAITTKFWFTKGSGRLEAGKSVRWDWEMFGISVDVRVKEIVENRLIVVEWGNYDTPTRVEWTFTPRSVDSTYVSITTAGFSGDGDEMVRQALDSMGGFTWVLAGAKAYLEHGLCLNLIADRYPDGH